jgi:hypothetical protein
MNPIKIRIPNSDCDYKKYAEMLCQHVSDTVAIMPVALRDWPTFQLTTMITTLMVSKVFKAVESFELELNHLKAAQITTTPAVSGMTYMPYKVDENEILYKRKNTYDRPDRSAMSKYHHAEVLLK